jgi:hypothetical protein
METLEQEAEWYARYECGELYEVSLYHNKAHTYGSSATKDFIAGANSKYVQRDRVKAQIEVLEELIKKEHSDNFWALENKRLELLQQLKELER